MKKGKFKYILIIVLLFMLILLFILDYNFIASTMNCDSVVLKSAEQTYYQDRVSWIPDDKAIKLFEYKIGNYLLKEYILSFFIRNEDTSDPTHIFYVIKNLKSYKRQYLGVTIDGKKILHCNCLLINHKSLLDLEDVWKFYYIDVCDGGPRFWQIDFDMSRKQFQSLFIHM
jgi:hypothetical protein